MTPTDVDDHHNHLHTHFRVKPAKLAAFRTKRETHETNVRAVQEHFHARRASVLAGVIAPNHESKKEVSQ